MDCKDAVVLVAFFASGSTIVAGGGAVPFVSGEGLVGGRAAAGFFTPSSTFYICNIYETVFIMSAYF